MLLLRIIIENCFSLFNAFLFLSRDIAFLSEHLPSDSVIRSVVMFKSHNVRAQYLSMRGGFISVLFMVCGVSARVVFDAALLLRSFL